MLLAGLWLRLLGCRSVYKYSECQFKVGSLRAPGWQAVTASKIGAVPRRRYGDLAKLAYHALLQVSARGATSRTLSLLSMTPTRDLREISGPFKRRGTARHY